MNIKQSPLTPVKTTVSLMLATALLNGCARDIPPYEEITRSSYAVKEAEERGARDLAPLELRNASKTLGKAQEAIKAQKYDLTRRYAAQAELEANYATAKAEALKAQKAADELKESIRVLKEELHRYQPEK
ncbi:MAG: DUF4398 domain-containing protein [Methylobacter sp.]